MMNIEKRGIIFLWLIQLGLAWEQELVISAAESKTNETRWSSDYSVVAEGESQLLDFRFIRCSANDSEPRDLQLLLKEGLKETLRFPEFVHNVPCLPKKTSEFGVRETIFAESVGFVKIKVQDVRTHKVYAIYSVGVTKPRLQIQNQVYSYGNLVLSIATTFSFGTSLNEEKVKNHLKKPIAPAIAMACQFILMPGIGYLISLAMTTEGYLKLGIWALLATPKWVWPNIWCFVLNGDVDLSVTITYLNAYASLGFLYLWIYILDRYIIKDDIVRISGFTDDIVRIPFPFRTIATLLAIIEVLLKLGILINRFLPKVAKIVKYVQKPVIIIFILFAGGMSVWTNFYAFKIVLSSWELSLCTFLLPCIGGLLGFLIGLACKQGKQIALTIGIGLAIQNSSFSTEILRTSLTPLSADMCSAVPFVMGFFTFLAFLLFSAIQQIYLRYRKYKNERKEDDRVELTNNTSNNLELREDQGVDNSTTSNEDGV